MKFQKLHPHKDEYIASAIRRGNELSGLKHDRSKEVSAYKIQQPYKHTKTFPPKIQFPAYMVELGITLNVLQNHTLYPICAALGRTDSSNNYTPHRHWKICLICAIEDIEEFGTVIIRRQNTLVYAKACDKHGATLHEYCPACNKSITTHSILKFDSCTKKYKAQAGSLDSPKHRYAKFIKELLEYDEVHLTQTFTDSLIISMGSDIRFSESHPYLRCIELYINDSLDIPLPKTGALQNMGISRFSAHAFTIFQDASNYLKHLKDIQEKIRARYIVQEKTIMKSQL
jgi:hypothetical protein